MFLLLCIFTKIYYFYHLLGSDRTVDSIRNKISRILDIYYKAGDRLRDTGAGLYGTEFTTFRQSVIKNHCRFYEDLEQVLGDRPNVHAWYTNEDSELKHKDSSGDHEIVLSEQESFMSSNDVEVIGCYNSNKVRFVPEASGTNLYSNILLPEVKGTCSTFCTTSFCMIRRVPV
jgi:hypothetical protein